MKTTSTPILAIPLFLAHLSAAISAIDCKQRIVVDGRKFDFSKLDAPHSVSVIDEDSPPAVYNTTWTVNVCRPIPINKDLPNYKEEQCPSGTNVCGVRRSYNPVEDPDKKDYKIENVIPIAGSWSQDSGHTLEPKWTRLKTLDSDEEGLQLELQGRKYGNRKQKAIIHFQCDPDRTGNDSEDDRGKRDASEVGTGDLRYKSYGPVEQKGDVIDVLRLNWRTKYACEDYKDGDGDKTAGWGFFTWFILILFLGIAAYLIFGSWLNYSRYGARGWDLLPHGDTIRDIPYLVQDWSRKVVDTVSGGGSRGGYSAV